RDPATFQDARDLLGRLRVRRDLLATVAEEIDDVVVREPRGSGRVHLGKTSVGSSPFVSVIDGKNCWQLPSVPFSGVLNHQDGSSVNIAHPALPSFLKRRLTRVAGQKIWMHFLLWQIPFLHFLLVWVSGWDPFNFKNSALTLMLTAIPIGIVSAFLLFNLVPFLAAVAAFFSLLFSISYFLRDIDYSYNFVALLVLLVSGMMGGFLSRWSILSCRKKAVIP
ncbi:MAG: hypothetical protein VKO26_07375, partial [Cyanobacteriota bacterium]|nr:hypothetical protein [Cyanobacteriota bacterium]